MEELSKAHKARIAIRTFKTTADALALRGYYKPSGKSGRTLAEALQMLSPEIYGTLNDPRIIELKGLEYVIDRLPRGIESCTRITLTAQEDLARTSFEPIEPPRRRRISYRISEREICFVITRGLSEIYDVLSHLTFLNLEGIKIKNQIINNSRDTTAEWGKLKETAMSAEQLDGEALDRALWNLSIILGRTYQETRRTYESLEESRRTHGSNNGLCRIIHDLGIRAFNEEKAGENDLIIYFTPSLRDMIGHHQYSRKWAADIKARLSDLGLMDRPLHIISANLHSVVNILYGFAVDGGRPDEDLYQLCERLRESTSTIQSYARDHGFHELPDRSGAHIDCQIIDTAALDPVPRHPGLAVQLPAAAADWPVILVMDYAFGTQAFEVMDELLAPTPDADGAEQKLSVVSISVMGKAGTLPGRKGDIMLATAHVFEGTPHNYPVENDLSPSDFDPSVAVHVGPILTVLGTSLQNRDMLEKFQSTSWRAVGLEMEGGHYHRAISAAVIRGHIPRDVRVRYAYYASDNPLISGQTLASGGMGAEGIRPTYMITKVILEKILAPSPDSADVSRRGPD